MGAFRGMSVAPAASERTAQLLPQGLEDTVHVLVVGQHRTGKFGSFAVRGVAATNGDLGVLALVLYFQGDVAATPGTTAAA